MVSGNSIIIFERAHRRGQSFDFKRIMSMIRNFFRRRTFLIVIVTLCLCLFTFSYLTYVPPNINNLQLPSAAVNVVSSTTAGSLMENVTSRAHPKSVKKHNTHVSYPWRDDPVCKNFTVQVLIILFNI